jgi:hypothetical protein
LRGSAERAGAPPGCRWPWRGRVGGHGWGLGFRPRGAGRREPRGRGQSSPGPDSPPAANHRLAAPPPPAVSFVPAGRVAAAGLRPCGFRPAPTAPCACACVGPPGARPADGFVHSCVRICPKGLRRVLLKSQKSALERSNFDLGQGWYGCVPGPGQWSTPGPTFPSWAAVVLGLSRFLALSRLLSLPRRLPDTPA